MQKPTFLLLSALLALSGCVFPGVYRIDVQQGNIIEAEQLETLKVGMTRRQVRFVLGNPVVNHTFDDSIETYVYTLQLEGGKINRQIIDLRYEGEVLAAIDAREVLEPELANPGEAYKVRNRTKPAWYEWWKDDNTVAVSDDS